MKPTSLDDYDSLLHTVAAVYETLMPIAIHRCKEERLTPSLVTHLNDPNATSFFILDRCVLCMNDPVVLFWMLFHR